MKTVCIQMDMAFCRPDENYVRAESLIREAVSKYSPDTVVLPETWNTGFFPRENLEVLADWKGERTMALLSSLSAELGVNIVGGSVTRRDEGGIWNTCYVYDRKGSLVASYDKAHLFSPMEEDRYYTKGDHVCRFRLDGTDCAVIICYDVRFPEWTRAMTVEGVDILFMVSQWPLVRVEHLEILTRARAIENQMFLVLANSAGRAGDTKYGGASSVTDPWGKTVAHAAGDGEELVYAELDESILSGIRSSINVFADRRPQLYKAFNKD